MFIRSGLNKMSVTIIMIVNYFEEDWYYYITRVITSKHVCKL